MLSYLLAANCLASALGAQTEASMSTPWKCDDITPDLCQGTRRSSNFFFLEQIKPHRFDLVTGLRTTNGVVTIRGLNVRLKTRFGEEELLWMRA
jgi:hypothetical protein